tara:strand:- start:1089 stop:1382 length:294 start_codon:yes stop_codon:yes gene_type:complete
MSNEIKSDDIIFNFFKQICDEKNDNKCIEFGNSCVSAMETKLNNMEANLKESDLMKHNQNINNNKKYLNTLKNKTTGEWREYATQRMIEILNHKDKS